MRKPRSSNQAELQNPALLTILMVLVPCICSAESRVKVTFEFSSADLTANEPIYLRLAIHNGLPETIRFVPPVLRDDYLDLSVTEPNNLVVAPNPVTHGGFLHVSAIMLPAGESMTKLILANEYYQFRSPGIYRVKVRLNGPFHTESGNQIDQSWQDLPLRIAPRDPRRLDKVCQTLAEAAAGYGNYEGLRDAATALSYVQDPVAVPYLERVLSYDNFVSEIAVDGLVRMGGDRPLQVLRSHLNMGSPALRAKIQQGIYEINTGRHGRIMD